MGAKRQLHGFPVDAWVVSLQPAEAEDNGRFDFRDVEECDFGVDVPNGRRDQDIFGDGVTYLAVAHEQGPGDRAFLCQDLLIPYELTVDIATSRSATIDQAIHGNGLRERQGGFNEQ